MTWHWNTHWPVNAVLTATHLPAWRALVANSASSHGRGDTMTPCAEIGGIFSPFAAEHDLSLAGDDAAAGFGNFHRTELAAMLTAAQSNELSTQQVAISGCDAVQNRYIGLRITM